MKPRSLKKRIVVDMKNYAHIGKMNDFEWSLLCDICTISGINKECQFMLGAYAIECN